MPGSATAIDSTDRAFLESRLGDRFGDVRLHTGADAAAAAAALGARAFTIGTDVVVGAQQYQPGTTRFRRLLAHELTHVVQQRGSAGLLTPPRVGAVGDRFEREADDVASGALAGRPVAIRERAGAPVIQRAPVAPAPSTQMTLPDGRTLDGAMLEQLLLAVPAVAPHVQTKVAAGHTAAGHTHFLDPAAFLDRFVLYAVPPGGTPRQDPRTPGTRFNHITARELGKSVNGFVDEATSELFIKQSGGIRGDAEILPTSIHEAVHFHANRRMVEYWGFNANEGLTDFFTAVVCAAHGIDPGSLAYDAQTSAVRPILDLQYMTLDEMAAWFFGRDYMLFERKALDVAVPWKAAMKAGSYPLAKSILMRGKPSTP